MFATPRLFPLFVFFAAGLVGACGPDRDAAGLEPDGGEGPGAEAPDSGSLTDAGSDAGSDAGTDAGGDAGADAGAEADAGSDGGVSGPPVFATGFHHALRASRNFPEQTTLRLRLPIGRAGTRVRVTLRAGGLGMRLDHASIAHAGADGQLVGTPVLLTFAGAPGATLTSRQSAVSDAVAFAVAFGDELFVTFSFQGSVSSSNMAAFPGSYLWSGDDVGAAVPPLGASAHATARGVSYIDVEGLPAKVVLALGDSITEGYVSDVSDTRQAWPFVAQTALGVTVLNGGVSGTDLAGELYAGEAEYGPAKGVTDCIVLLGTNDLPCSTPEAMETQYLALVAKLEPRCRVWAGTLVPKESAGAGSLEQVRACRTAFNGWLRNQSRFAGIIDFDAVTRSPSNPDLLKPEYRNDGIHPTSAGQAAMGSEAARVLAPAL